ncbi:polyribonucleotide nucleotidyltransferase [Candidatus Falkowbacteria bacterium CG10_big_fil_rev_8_21_14_0_10_37_14]|uniref:Polyribonucleotide nucleotidyltransferase n=1 Tax=Candidatus Falkowbacteria bacterium CG10_big_fil_rev_8_21_14_0_10_37_14 TaxID=1974561 RepID=A0A2M6WUU2_9BACT|nr:polyribonucleotide nucleotidyltransferase [Candidatus Falkowbacteria bacterium]PIT96476.1 MAG: polyribonucleotide nucleotidyltransferase [Candidatus Falkowbacteria bacterium CG10_big_fil_rev_8_21_14_0_10_37_14]
MRNDQVFSGEWLGRPLTFKTGKLAQQATAALTVQYGETVVLATVVESSEERSGLDFFPLSVDFEEKLYAAGIIKGSRWVKREGRPTDESVLTGRMIDRSIRPLFNQANRRDVQVVLTALSVDNENDFDIVALVGASAVLAISGIDWAGPLSGVRVGRVDGQFVFNPTYTQRLTSDLDLIVAGTPDRVLMIEADANEITEADMLSAINAGREALRGAYDLIVEMQKALNVEVRQIVVNDVIASIEDADKKSLYVSAKEWLASNIKTILFDKTYYTKGERKLAVKAIKEQLTTALMDAGYAPADIKLAVHDLAEDMINAEVTRAILSEDRRVDGRKLNEIRDLSSEVALFPRTHGTGLFMRGETQVLSIATLGAPGLEQNLEGMEGQSKKRYMHHYNFPAFSVGEARPNRGAGRREIGHGALAEKAIVPMLPTKEEFPYTIRVVSETLGSNGSSSMGATCGSTLALMDAGVPLKRPVAGIAMGLASNHDMSAWKVLTDLQDLEDGDGGMDFKITGTSEGITAVQLDTKTIGLNEEIVKQALEKGYEARLQVLAVMNEAIATPRAELSPYAPRLISFRINPDQIREVIGSGGKVINKIIEECGGVSIDIEDDGLVMVCGTDAAGVEKAVSWIKDITRVINAGEVFPGTVVRMLDFGAFIEILPGRDGMVHVSELAPYRISSPDNFLTIGQQVHVRVKEIDEQGRVNLTMKGLTENEALWAEEKGKEAPRPEGSFNRDARPDRRPSTGGRPISRR